KPWPHRHSPVSVKAAQKNGFEKSLECNRVNCASRHACTRSSPELQRRTNSIISSLVALSLTFYWLASTVSAPAMRKARRKDITPSPILTSPTKSLRRWKAGDKSLERYCPTANRLEITPTASSIDAASPKSIRSTTTPPESPTSGKVRYAA